MSRRRQRSGRRLPVLLTLLTLALLALGGSLRAQAVESVGITVADLDRSVRFYRDVLTFREEGRAELHGDAIERVQGVFGARLLRARLRLGQEVLELTQYLAPEGRPMPADARGNDQAFQHVALIVRDMDAAYARLREHRVRHASPGPQTLPDWNPTAGGIRAFYFKDPDGHFLEILQFPAGKGDARWHAPGDDLFLGIDHTAIVVRDTEQSLRFWRDGLGLRVASGSENHGIEQERLNNVFGARLRITTLRGTAGPGVELLEYLAPGPGADRPADSRSCDLWHWQVQIVVPDAGKAEQALRAQKAAWVSPGLVRDTDRAQGLVRDPDGHTARIADR